MDRNKKEGRYSRVFEQLEQLVVLVKNPMSRMATIVAVLHHKFDYFFWTGFYLLENSHDLVVGPYQGTVACMRLKQHTGVCWAGIDSHKPVIVGDVERFPGHIACSSLSKSVITSYSIHYTKLYEKG